MNEKKQIAINIASNMISFAVSLCINFFLSPYIINNVGSAAYGFVSLGNQFVSYIQIITVALNSMAARFITLKLYENKEQDAKVYFSSVFFSNIILTLLVTGPLTILVLFVDRILEVPLDIVFDVKILWSLIFVNFAISLIMNVFSIATYAKNRLELASLRSIEANIIRGILLVILYLVFKPSIVYIGIGALVTTMFIVLSNVYYTRSLLPEMNIKRKYFKLSAVKELISSGVWNSLTQLSTTLLAGLDLLIANLFVGATSMGILAVAKTIPTLINQLLGTIPGAFSPQFMIDYAHKDTKKLLLDINFAIKIMSVISCIPLVGLAVFGKAFFSLWVPTQDSQVLHILSMLAVATTFFTAPIKPLYTIYTVTNKVKMESISVFVQGVLSTAIVFVLLYILRNSESELIKLCVIAGVSTTLGIIRCLTFTPIYAARCLKLKWNVFYSAIGKSVMAFIILYLVESVFYKLMPTSTWFTLIITGGIASIVGLIINLFLVLNKNEQRIVIGKVKEKIIR